MSPATSDSPFFFSAKFWRTLVVLCLAVGFLRGFWEEVQLVWKFFAALLEFVLIKPVQIPFDDKTQLALITVGVNVAIFIFGYLALLVWIAQFTLPVRGWQNRWMVFKRVFFYDLPFVRLHGPAIFVKEGKSKATVDELSSTKPGVALVDQYSAIVLEHERGAKVRACGPGITFTRRGEKIIDFVDLRKQSRSRKDVSCSTGDGIEVITKISTLFTVGQPPDILKVTKIMNKWLTVTFENNSRKRKKISEITNDLDEVDQEEIDQFFRKYNKESTIDDSVDKEIINDDILPFTFDAERIKNAVYSRARNVKEGGIGQWTDLPLDVAVDIFRNKLAHRPYDELYLPDDPEKYPMKDFKREFSNAVRNTGILDYQIIMRTDGQPLEKGRAYHKSELVYFPRQNFKRSTILRDRSIKIYSASFGSLDPKNDVIHKRYFDNWQARWQEESEKTTAEYELEAMRIRNRERAKAQQDMIYSLSQILQTEQYASEALAMRLYQALEMAATQPATQRLLPADTVQMLQNLREWLLPEKQNNENPLDREFFDGLEIR